MLTEGGRRSPVRKGGSIDATSPSPTLRLPAETAGAAREQPEAVIQSLQMLLSSVAMRISKLVTSTSAH